jgi:hypothetical protein
VNRGIVAGATTLVTAAAGLASARVPAAAKGSPFPGGTGFAELDYVELT